MNKSDFKKAALLMATYENRETVKRGNDAQAKREELVDRLSLDDYEKTDVEEIINSGE